MSAPPYGVRFELGSRSKGCMRERGALRMVRSRGADRPEQLLHTHSASKSVTPKANTSDANVGLSPWITSGAAHSAEPMSSVETPCRECLDSPRARLADASKSLTAFGNLDCRCCTFICD